MGRLPIFDTVVMRIPNADRAIIGPEKLRDYLLNVAHRRGATKAKLLLGLGYDAENYQRLEMDLRKQHLILDATLEQNSTYGARHSIVAPIRTPIGRMVTFCSVWQIDTGTDVPRLITMYPR